jgi:G3E family GTPase
MTTPFGGWIDGILKEKGQDLLRTKGILHFRGKDQRFVFQAVHMLADGGPIGPWKEGAPRQSRIVFIGRNVNRSELQRGLRLTLRAEAVGSWISLTRQREDDGPTG